MFSLPAHSRRLTCLLGTALLVACGSDPVAPEPITPEPSTMPSARWAGSYTGQARFGATNGTWGNGGTYALVIANSGDVTIRGALLQDPFYDDQTATLRWAMAAGNATNGEVIFQRSLTSDFFFRDLSNATAGQNLTGYIQRPQEGRLDYRGVLR